MGVLLYVVNMYTVIDIQIKQYNYMCTPIVCIYKQLHVIVLYIATKLYLFLIMCKLTVCGRRESLRHLTSSGSAYTVWQFIAFLVLLKAYGFLKRVGS